MIAILTVILLLVPLTASAQEPAFTRADTLRGSITPERAWWDVEFYDLNVTVNPADSTISGYNAITYLVVADAGEMQIDLMNPLQVDRIVQAGADLEFRREGDVILVNLTEPQLLGEYATVTVHYHGRPIVAVNAPWDGGFVWARDTLSRPWVATAVQGLGASAWWPNKDTQVEEPDSQRIAITVPDPLIDVSNGRLRSTTSNGDGTTTYEWFVSNPINNYNVSVNIGGYAHFSDIYLGERGTLTLDYWPLDYNLDEAKEQFAQVLPMLTCFESWFGPYPWYEDGFKLVETPHLGMEHQSAIAYGNEYMNGYLGRDLSHTGLGLEWDFIIIHEAAHEWWGNNITTRDRADMWVHESFANYAEGLYTECLMGKEAGATYTIGTRANVQNDRPIIAPYGVNAEGSGDMYYKGGNMLHTIRQLVDDDDLWRSILRGLNEEFWHQTVTGQQVQDYISRRSGIDLDEVFDQYLTTTDIPTLLTSIEGPTLRYKWTNVVPGFDMPVRVKLSANGFEWIQPTEEWQSVTHELADPASFAVDRNFYITSIQAVPGGV